VLDALEQEPAQLLNAADEHVPLTLELPEAEQAGTREGLHRRAHSGGRDVREGFRDDARQIPLEPRHLRPQGVPRRALPTLNVEIDNWLLRPIGSHTRLLKITLRRQILPPRRGLVRVSRSGLSERSQPQGSWPSELLERRAAGPQRLLYVQGRHTRDLHGEQRQPVGVTGGLVPRGELSEQGR
jgi:hypothetical protein